VCICVRHIIAVRSAVRVSFYKCPKSKWYAPQCGWESRNGIIIITGVYICGAVLPEPFELRVKKTPSSAYIQSADFRFLFIFFLLIVRSTVLARPRIHQSYCAAVEYRFVVSFITISYKIF